MRGSFRMKLVVVAAGFSLGTSLAQPTFLERLSSPRAFAQSTASSAPTVADLTKRLATATGAERLAVINALADHGAAAAPAVDALAALLGDGDEATRINAAKALGAIGPDAAPALGALVTGLDTATPTLRAYELYALGRIGEKAQSAFPKVAEQLTSDDAQVRREAVKAMRQMKLPLATTVPVLVKVLESAKSAEEVMPALHAMSEVGKAGVPRLVEAMKTQPIARFWICRILGEMGPDAADAVPEVTAVLGDERTDVRREAVLCLGHIGKPAAAATADLVKQLADQDAGIRAATIWALMMVGASPAEVLPAVKPLITDKDDMVKLVSAWSVAKMEPENMSQRRASLDLFISALKNENPRLRAAAARAIVDLKSGDEAAREALIAALADGDPAVSGIVGHAMVQMGEESVPMLVKGLDRKGIRGFAAQTLAQLGPKGKAAVPALTTALADENEQVRAAVLFALGSVAPDDADVVAKLVAALADKSADVRLAAIDSLAMNKGAAATAKPALQKLLTDPNPAIRSAAEFALEAPNQK